MCSDSANDLPSMEILRKLTRSQSPSTSSMIKPLQKSCNDTSLSLPSFKLKAGH